MIRYVLNNDESLCCGCRACQHACPVGAISMAPNGEGFLYPVVDRDRCVGCGLCSRVCPMEHRPAGEPVRAVYAVQHRDAAILKASSSGGVFRMLADQVLRGGGCVAGCKWDGENRPVLAVAEREEELGPMQGSKYLSSDTGSVYTQVKQRLENGQTVLFTGAPCQCAGLLNYLKKPYDNLITADFLCHGMPSQQIFDAYVSALEERYGAKGYDFRFRDKEARGWGMAMSFRYRKNGKEKKVCNIGWTDPYQNGFIHGYFNRYSCYACPFRGDQRFTDLTFCDYWGVERHHPLIPREKGVSAVSVNSEKGARLQAALSRTGDWTPTDPAAAAEENPSLLHQTVEKIPPLRRTIYDSIRREGWETVAKKHLRTSHSWLKKLWYRLPRDLTGKLKNLIK